MPDNFKKEENGVNIGNADSPKKDIYFTNQDYSGVKTDKKPAAKAVSKAKGKKGGVASTYWFFIIVIAVSMVISVYAIFCLNDIFGITKSKDSVTVSYAQEIDNTSDAVDVLAENHLIKCKNFCKFYIKLASKVVGSYDIEAPFQAGVYYLNGKMGLEGMLTSMMGTPETTETVKVMICLLTHLTLPTKA